MNAFLPFTQDQFFAVFAAYNEAIWPAQIVAYAVGSAAVAAPFLARARWGPALVTVVLAAMWAWTGVAYHWFHFAAINAAAYLFGAMFVVQTGVLLLYGVMLRRLRFARPTPVESVAGLGFVLYALVLYPSIGVWSGHSYPAAPTFGVTPCPVTIFTFGLLLLTTGRVPWAVLAVPLLWSLIGGSAAVMLHVPQDWALPVSAAACVALLWRRK